MLKRWNRKMSRPVTQIEHVFHGIEVVPGEQCCEAARKASEMRFLSSEAPRLPLEDCDRLGACQCRYKHYPDRRTEVRRDWDAGLPKRNIRDDRRDGVGRRITD